MSLSLTMDCTWRQPAVLEGSLAQTEFESRWLHSKAPNNQTHLVQIHDPQSLFLLNSMYPTQVRVVLNEIKNKHQELLRLYITSILLNQRTSTVFFSKFMACCFGFYFLLHNIYNYISQKILENMVSVTWFFFYTRFATYISVNEQSHQIITWKKGRTRKKGYTGKPTILPVGCPDFSLSYVRDVAILKKIYSNKKRSLETTSTFQEENISQ